MKGLERSRSRGRQGIVPISKMIIPIRNKVINVTDPGAAVAWDTEVIGDFPEGNILFMGAIAYLQYSSSAAGVSATFDGDFSIGTAPTADSTLSGAEVDIIPSTPFGAATAKVSPIIRATHAVAVAGTIYDNTDGSLELNLNTLIDDTGISATSDFTLNGFFQMLYAVLGDD
jgi:hypothetical protein